MKKIIFTSIIAIISFTTFAQGNSGKNKSQNGNSSYKKDKDREDDRYEDRNDDRNKKAKKNKKYDRYDDQDGRDRRDDRDNNNDNKYSKNTPRKVGDAFRRDFPNANNVSWTKNSGSWTATFNNGGLIPVNRSVTYRANGERVSSNGIF